MTVFFTTGKERCLLEKYIINFLKVMARAYHRKKDGKSIKEFLLIPQGLWKNDCFLIYFWIYFGYVLDIKIYSLASQGYVFFLFSP